MLHYTSSFNKPLFLLVSLLCLCISALGDTTNPLTDLTTSCSTLLVEPKLNPQKTGLFNGVFIIAGSTGDLAKRKLIPALYELLKNKNLQGLIIFTGRQENLTAADIIKKAEPFIKNLDPVLLEKLTALSTYWRLSGNDTDEFIGLRNYIEDREKASCLSGARVTFLALPADSFCPFTQNLVKSGVITPNNKQQRIVYEKPFGSDLASAREINTCIKNNLALEQAYRVDHYLAKTILESMPSLIAQSTLLSSAWNNTGIQAVKIFFDEPMGLEGRGAFYDRYGALRDVIQNHVLQMLATVAAGFQRTKLEVLKALTIKHGVLGQYAHYQEEPGVADKSATETYAALEIGVDLPEWKNVPFFVQTGKHLKRKATEIQVIFVPKAGQSSDVLTFSITPEERVTLTLHATELDGTVKTINLSSVFTTHTVDAYENLLFDLMSGQSKASVSLDEIEAQWSFIEKVQALKLPLVCYEKNSSGPSSGQLLMGVLS